MGALGSTVTRLGCFWILLAGLAGCSMSEDQNLPAWNGGTCPEGATRPCGVALSVSSATASCYTGEQTCHLGRWGSCQNGTVTEKQLPATGQSWGLLPGTSLQALSTVTDCSGSPCDPTCQVFDEQPDTPLTAEGHPAGASWQTGNIVDLLSSNIPNGFISKGISSDCKTAGDCQFDEFCELSGATNGCAHSKCTTGGPLNNLDTACNDACVDKICGAGGDPTCCSSESTTCSHRKCDTGAPLTSTCDSCVGQICAVHPECCVAPCTSGVAKPTAATGSCEAKVCAKNPSCCTDSPCGHDPCTTGNALASTCKTQVGTVCQSRPECCASGCSDFSPCSTNSSRKIQGSCTVAPESSAIADTCADNPSCCVLGSCSHSPFDSGTSGTRGLATGCDKNPGPDVVKNVCSGQSYSLASCCDTSKSKNWTSTCVNLYMRALVGETACTPHSPWVTGAKLTNKCDSAGANVVDQLCNSSTGTNKTCCTASGSSAWSSTCVSAYTNAVKARIQSGWTSTCRDLYLSKLSTRVGHTVTSGDCSWTNACVTAYTNTLGTGQSCQTNWSTQCLGLVQSECGVDCSKNTWSSTCVDAVSSVCNQVCANWTRSCVDKVAAMCGAFCPQTGTCAHNRCLTGGPLASDCDSCVGQICALDPSCCSSEWDTYCVVKVGSVCGINCDQEVSSTGTCVPWMPNDKNEACAGIDLTVGVPCGDKVPVCNRGSQDLPPAAPLQSPPVPSLTLAAYTGNSQHMQDPCNVVPDTDTRQCTYDNGIPAGKCVDVECPGVFDNLREIVVNPGQVGFPECACDNNWSVYKKPDPQHGLECSAPDCAAATTEASMAKVNMLLMFDKSGSMCETQACCGCTNPGSGTRWGLTTSALKTFLKDSKSAGLRVALRFFPDTVTSGSVSYDCSSSDCGTFDNCAVPQVGLAELKAATQTTYPSNCSSSTDPQECLLVKAIAAEYPNGSTPTRIALGGAYQYMADFAAVHPFERSFVVLVTDGEPNDCSDGYATILPQMAQDAYRDYGIVTFTIGIDHQGGTTLLQNIATQGHGQAFMVAATGSGASTGFLNALDTIRTQAASCEFPIDQTNPIDPQNVKVQYTPNGAGNPVNLTRVDSQDACGTGWYFDDINAPTKITLCSASCDTVRADSAAKVTVALGCPMEYQVQTRSEAYTASCPRGQGPQWGYLAYNASTPGASTVKFEATTAPDPSLLTEPPSTPVVTAAVAHGAVGAYATDTQVCGMGGPSPCPVSLYTVLGSPAAFNPALQLRITLQPAVGAAPTLTDWKVTYSCIDNM